MAKDQTPAQTLPETARVAPSPHVSDQSFTTRRMMIDVIIGLLPAILVGFYVFHFQAIQQLLLATLACLAAEWLIVRMRGRRATLGDCSAVITGLILGMSLPATAPWYVPVIGGIVAIGLGKCIFGGLGFNIFNPAMVGRAFVMLSFANVMGAGEYERAHLYIDGVSTATPLTIIKAGGELPDLWPVFLGTINGSVGEASALALLLGGIYICVRRAASWQIPLGVLLAVALIAGPAHSLGLTPLPPGLHLASGALMLGAFFIATDPVSSPLTAKAKFIYGLGIGGFVMLLRIFSGYPEGLMFAILLMNAVAPMLNRWTVPRPIGGPAPQPAA